MVCVGYGISPLVLNMLLSDPARVIPAALACGLNSKSGQRQPQQHALRRRRFPVDILEVRLTLQSRL